MQENVAEIVYYRELRKIGEKLFWLFVQTRDKKPRSVYFANYFRESSDVR